ncbi:cytochrome b5 [Ophiostoma piceae UAMH 11346]|uniref:Cytochrome b5 n=1 Tax=Ophiostoma piceae (strain UAMH 11346) TaxID=1262450 RepID=S3BPH1_OPHP1|nr:cytochrome b5 [Ophiostoma piceae UAMH 11346]
MGWLSQNSPLSYRDSSGQSSGAASTESPREGYTGNGHRCEAYHFVPLSMKDSDLPFIPTSAVQDSATSSRLWIVIDNTIYDCSEFLAIHPGGPDMLRSFRASDCTWQFRRFHSTDTLRQHGQALRIGRTEGVANRFQERPRFVGLTPLGADF